MQPEILKFATQVCKKPKDAEIDVAALQQFVEMLPDWTVQGPLYTLAKSYSYNTEIWITEAIQVLGIETQEPLALLAKRLQKDKAFLHQVVAHLSKTDASLLGTHNEYRSRQRQLARKRVYQQHGEIKNVKVWRKHLDEAERPGTVHILVDEPLPTTGAEDDWYLTNFRITVEEYQNQYGRGPDLYVNVKWAPYIVAESYRVTPPSGEPFLIQQSANAEWKQPSFWKWAADGPLLSACQSLLDNTDEFEKKWLLRRKGSDKAREDTGTCSWCFRDIVLDRDYNPPHMVLHGYERPGIGFIIGHCNGQQYAPYELSCEGTKVYRSKITEHYENSKRAWKDYQAGVYAKTKLPAHREVPKESWRGMDRWMYGSPPVNTDSKEPVVYEKCYLSPSQPEWKAVYQEFGHKLQSAFAQVESLYNFLTEMIDTWKTRPLPLDLLKQQRASK